MVKDPEGLPYKETERFEMHREGKTLKTEASWSDVATSQGLPAAVGAGRGDLLGFS